MKKSNIKEVKAIEEISTSTEIFDDTLLSDTSVIEHPARIKKFAGYGEVIREDGVHYAEKLFQEAHSCVIEFFEGFVKQPFSVINYLTPYEAKKAMEGFLALGKERIAVCHDNYLNVQMVMENITPPPATLDDIKSGTNAFALALMKAKEKAHC